MLKKKHFNIIILVFLVTPCHFLHQSLSHIKIFTIVGAKEARYLSTT